MWCLIAGLMYALGRGSRMGIDVSTGKLVTLNDNHEKRVVTAVKLNPARQSVGDIPVMSVFRRTKTGDAERDGNPLIYALKGLNGYGILPYWQTRIMNRACDIIINIEELKAFDEIIVVPSSNGFCAAFATLVSNMLGLPILQGAFIQKKTVGQMLAGFDGIPNTVRKQDRKEFGAQLKQWQELRPGTMVSMKLISPAIRRYLDPFTITANGVPDLTDRKVLIVDDLLSSGASISSISNLLKAQGATVGALCFLSRI